MNHIILARRALLGATVLATPALLLGCAPGDMIQTVTAQSVTDVDLIANALESGLPALQILTGANLTAVSTVTAEIKSIVAAAAGFVPTVSQATGQNIVRQISTDFGALTQALSGTPLPPNVQTVLLAVQALLPLIEVAVGLVTASVKAGVQNGAQTGGMTPAAARAVLQAATEQ